MLIQGGIEPDINTLEYWGENPELQARVEPLAKLVGDILVHASAMAEAEATRLASTLVRGGNDQKIGDDWVVMDNMKQQAIYGGRSGLDVGRASLSPHLHPRSLERWLGIVTVCLKRAQAADRFMSVSCERLLRARIEPRPDHGDLSTVWR